jgi:hypothetical protein
MAPFGIFRLKFPLGIADSGRGPIAAIGAASRSRVCWPDALAAAPSGGARVRVPPPAFLSVLSKSPNRGRNLQLCGGAPRQKAAESRKIPESGSVIPREGVERSPQSPGPSRRTKPVIPREGVESAYPTVPDGSRPYCDLADLREGTKKATRQ